MLLEFFKQINLLKINLLNLYESEEQENLELGLELEEKHEKDNLFEESIIELFFLNARAINFFNKISFFINNNNLLICNFLIKIRYNIFSNVTFLLGQFEKNKFQWTNFNYLPYKLFTRIKHVFLIQRMISKQNITNRWKRVKRIITFKKKNGFLKRRAKIKNFLLLKLNNLKNYKLLNRLMPKNKLFWKGNANFTNQIFFKAFKKNTRQRDVSKFFDFKKRWCRIFSTNRDLLKTYSNVKKTKQFQITRNFAKFLKKSSFSKLIETEFSLLNILIRSKITFTLPESSFFIKNNFVFVNGVCITNQNHKVSINDVVSVIFNKKYFFFYKTNFNKKLKLTYGLGYRLWRLNRFRNNLYKQSPTGIPEWVYKLSFFYEDVPSFIEVDYTILTLTIVKLPTKFFFYNFYFTKFISSYLLRLYNWKSVI